MVISVTRSRDGAKLTLRRNKEDDEGEYEATIGAGESALGYTYEEWVAALGPQKQRRVELAEDGALRPEADEFDAPADGHA